MFAIGVENALACRVTLLIGAALALALGWYRAGKAGLPRKSIILVTVLLPLLAAFFSHLCYCLVNAGDVLYSQPFGYLLSFWQEGHMMYGMLLGIVLALLIGGGRRRMMFLEQYAPSTALMVVFARLAEGMVGQGYGEYWFGEENLFCRFPFMVYDPYYEAWGWALFMLGAAIAAVLLVVLLVRRKPAFEGDSMLLLLGFYAAAQVVMESLRRDEFLRWGFVRVEELLSAVVILLILLFFCLRSGRKQALQKALCFALFAAMVVFCLLLEFATEGRIPFLLFLEVWQCYFCMALACVVLAGCVLWMRHIMISAKE